MALQPSEILKIKKYFYNQPVIKAWLFGSHSRGVAKNSSDIDILVELDHTQPIGLKFITMQLDLEKLLQAKVDLLSENAISKYIKPFIDNDKVLIYEK